LYDDKNDTTCETILLSTSTKIRKDLEIANMVNTITNLNLPIFIDCAESITHYSKLSCDQVFLSKVIEGQELNIS
jgi:DNA repair protein SbcC/Rad50